MGKPRKPTNVLALAGSFKTHPERAADRANEPQPTEDIGDCPKCLNDAQRACWEEIVADAHAGTLSRADRMIVEQLARVLCHIRADGEHVDSRLSVRLERGLAALGMTPADRSRVSVKPKGNGNPFAKFKRTA